MAKKIPLQKGLFISFEGGEGVGKSTQIKLLAISLEREGFTVRCVREPGGTKIGEAIRTITHDVTNTMMNYRAEALLLAAGRAQVVAEVYQPLLDKKQIVLADRYVDSSYVYQGVGRGLGYDAIKKINDFAINGLMPDITFLLDIDYEEGQRRRHISDKVDRLDLQKKSFYKAVEKGYHEIALLYKKRIVTIDADRDIQAVHNSIYEHTLKYIQRYLI